MKDVSSTTARPERVSAEGVSAATASKPSIGSKNDWPFWAFVVSAPKFQASTKLLAVTSEPSENFWPDLILIVQVCLSSDSIDSARSFSTLPSAV